MSREEWQARSTSLTHNQLSRDDRDESRIAASVLGLYDAILSENASMMVGAAPSFSSILSLFSTPNMAAQMPYPGPKSQHL